MRFFISRKRTFVVIQVMLLSLLISGSLKILGLLEALDNRCLGLFYYVREMRAFGGRPSAPDKGVVVVAIDDATLHSLDRHALRYDDYAQLLRAARLGGARAIGLDVSLSESDGGEDARLARELDKVILPYWLGKRKSVSELRRYPDSLLQENAAALGYVNPSYRRAGSEIQLLCGPHGGCSFPLAVLAVAAQKKPSDVQEDGYTVRVGPFQLPMERDHFFWINYFSPRFLEPGAGRHQISAADVLSGRIPPDAFHEKIVLIGETHRDTPHTVETPVGRLARVQVFANVISASLKGKFMARRSGALSAALLVALVVLTSLTVSRLRPVYSLFLFAPAPLAVICIGCSVFARWHYGMDTPLLLVGMSAAFTMMMSYVSYEHSEEVIALSAYIAPAVRRKIVRKIADAAQRIPIEGERKELSILFADLRGFTALSQKMDARETVALLNEYFDAVVPVIAMDGHEGTIDKFMGDGILTFFGDPYPFPDNPQRAVRTALAMREAFNRHYASWVSSGRLSGDASIGLGIGIATGPVVVGNIGCTIIRRMDYTVVGDAVNLAAALQGIAGGGQILLDRCTADLVREGFESCLIGTRQWKKITFEVHELIGPLEGEKTGGLPAAEPSGPEHGSLSDYQVS